jgi:hypothetical protein
LHVLKNLNFSHAKNDAEAHTESKSGLLFNRAKTTLYEGKEHVEGDSETETPVELEILACIVKLESASESRVFTSAFALTKTFESLMI